MAFAAQEQEHRLGALAREAGCELIEGQWQVADTLLLTNRNEGSSSGTMVENISAAYSAAEAVTKVEQPRFGVGALVLVGDFPAFVSAVLVKCCDDPNCPALAPYRVRIEDGSGGGHS